MSHHRRPPAEPRLAGTYAWYVMLLLLLCQTLSSLDGKLPFILVEALKRDLSLSDTQIGVITGPAFSLTYAIFALPIARLSDRRARKYVIAGAILIWSLFTAAGAFATGFATFAVSRVGVALGEAALLPAAHSLVAAYMPVRVRPRAMAMIAIGVALGGYAALAAGGWINDNYGWRSGLRLVGLAGAVLAALVVVTMKEPKREIDEARHDLPSGDIRSLLANPGVRNILIGGALLGLTSSAFASWGPAYVIRSYHLSTTQVGVSFGLVTGVVSIIGIISGGFLNSLVKSKGFAGSLRLLAIALVVSTLLQCVSLLTDNYVLFLALTGVTVLLLGLYFAPTFAAVQSLVNPNARSFAAAGALFAINGIGMASGAFLVGFLSDTLAPHFGKNALRLALLIAILPRLWSAFHYARAASAIRKTAQHNSASSVGPLNEQLS